MRRGGRSVYEEEGIRALEHAVCSCFYGLMQNRWDDGRLLTPPLAVESWRDERRLRHCIRFLFDDREMVTVQVDESCNVFSDLNRVLNLTAAVAMWGGEYSRIAQEKTNRAHQEAHYIAQQTITDPRKARETHEFFHRLQETVDVFYQRRDRGNLWMWDTRLDCFHYVYPSEAACWGAISDFEESRGRSTVNARMRTLARVIRDAANLVPDSGRFISAVFRRPSPENTAAPLQEPIRLLTRATSELALTQELAGTVSALSAEEMVALQRGMNQQIDRMATNVWNSFSAAPMGLGGGGGAIGPGPSVQELQASLMQQQNMSLGQARNQYDAVRRAQAQMRLSEFAQANMRNTVNPYLGQLSQIVGVDLAAEPGEAMAFARRYMAEHNEFLGMMAGQLYGRWDNHTQEAERKGMRVLRESLNAEQLSTLDREGFFEVRGGSSGKKYRIKTGRQMNIEEIDGRGRKVCGWCFVPKGSLVAGDVMLTQKLALELQEHEALRVANRF